MISLNWNSPARYEKTVVEQIAGDSTSDFAESASRNAAGFWLRQLQEAVRSSVSEQQ